MSSTGELIDIERVTISLEGGRWKSTRLGNSLAAYPTARAVLRGLRGSNPARLPGRWGNGLRETAPCRYPTGMWTILPHGLPLELSVAWGCMTIRT